VSTLRDIFLVLFALLYVVGAVVCALAALVLPAVLVWYLVTH
jgi:hypothetical protein